MSLDEGAEAMASIEAKDHDGVRIAVEGCGHGTLHAIYASIDESCRIKGWDGVDLLIIGGDFQAVRNQLDLNVTSMPQKYRKMADFHEYYSGARTAPYLTIFIGGNHEASNHLFELYYGGWVAPNIYYLGAANVVRFGPLRIAGLTGIWKGYDYRKPHFERLPYNREETGSIYHVRELDARKLLSLRSQVDIGLSHDWPQGIEMHGDYEWLFHNKRGFAEDSKSGKLGSVAARECLDRLRPPHWFSAHLHTKFCAILHHDPTDPVVRAMTNKRNGRRSPTTEDRPQIFGWQQFHASARQADTEEQDQILKDRENRRLGEQSTENSSAPQYTFNETFNKVGSDHGFERKVISTTQHQTNGAEEPASISNLDGCGFSRPTKRQRLGDEPANGSSATPNGAVQTNSASASSTLLPRSAVDNPDAIDIDMSDDDETVTQTTPLPVPQNPSAKSVLDDSVKPHDMSQSNSEESDGGGVKLNALASSFTSLQDLSTRDSAKASAGSPAASIKSSGSDLNPEAEAFKPQDAPGKDNSITTSSTQSSTLAAPQSEVSEEMRAQLAALSSNFTQEERIEVSPSLPFPEEISNKKTEFLALGKCEQYQEFLQLLSVKSTTSPEQEIVRPLKLSYDPEWLAIQRVFAPELQLGGHPSDKVPTHRGDTYYRDRIVEEQEWINEHVVKPGKLQVPENFGFTAPIYDPSLQFGADDMPREMTNPQTSVYCELIGIENKFDISEEERDFRMQQGPRPESAGYIDYHSRPRGGHGGGGRGRGGQGSGYRGGGGGRGGRGGGRGRGRGRR
ncbi:lariat debranching enzyme [Elasticomyces elasticus]|uniref:Lariat debranching enzyme n=1 Tax=Exophiala sideris TaxID=1016849 RepID=A0ABR0JHM3_9EURO|nr:lariat debranching enzyme [Elasticomyces elasticus]KAK5033463.1 lariat debranching enzyme [Exophiala sideris]KAK5042042.1 lariat debranching enzyme [Exophiala sideris]KAK5064007.1 lariat debranching enzyme [Exophiala sideris]KAK5185310.1 lariat debranching enzyme [Eurotiomycetes sp. CCFEE 6388]